MGVSWDVGLIDLDFLSRVILISGPLRQTFKRNNWPLYRFIIEVTLPWNRKNAAIENNSKIYQVWHLFNEKKYTEIMELLLLNLMNVDKKILFDDDI